MKEKSHLASRVKSFILAIIIVTLTQTATASDCYGWSITKRAKFMELLPQLLFYDKVNWINLDPSRSCTFKTYEAVFIQLLSPNLQATYQTYKKDK